MDEFSLLQFPSAVLLCWLDNRKAWSMFNPVSVCVCSLVGDLALSGVTPVKKAC